MQHGWRDCVTTFLGIEYMIAIQSNQEFNLIVDDVILHIIKKF